jgi:hypothetical protein
MGRGWKAQQKIDQARAQAHNEKAKANYLKKRKRDRSSCKSSGGVRKETREIVNQKIDQEEQAKRAKTIIRHKPKKAVPTKRGVQ